MEIEELAKINELEESLTQGYEAGLSQTGVLNISYQAKDGDTEQFCVMATDVELLFRRGTFPYPNSEISLDFDLLNDFCIGKINLREPETCVQLKALGDLALIQEAVTCCSTASLSTLEALRESESASLTLSSFEVTDLDNPTRDQFFEAIKGRVPRRITNLLDWNALNWTFDQIEENYGKEVYRPGSSENNTLGSLIQQFKSDNEVYSHGCAVPDSMRSEFNFPYLEEESLAPMQFWIGTRSEQPVTGLHRDARHVFLAQVLGRKKLVLYPPHESENLYLRKAHNDYFQGCWATPTISNPKDFPLLEKAKSVEVVLHPGDLLYIPLGWFHYVFAYDDVVSVSTIISELPSK